MGMGKNGPVWAGMSKIEIFGRFYSCSFVRIVAVIPLKIFKIGRMDMGVNGGLGPRGLNLICS